ncbi:hypothetical protein PtB15_5B174 [Puccinia triticina]|nr:hypothetical protein PtB15_5B174 [Puccinia triticina]
MVECHCSNCDVERFEVGREKAIHTTKYNFDELIAHPNNIEADPLNIPFEPLKTSTNWEPGPTDEPLVPVMEFFANSLVSDFETMFQELFDPTACDFPSSDLFAIGRARRVALGFDHGLLLEQVELLMDGEAVPGHLDLIQSAWNKFSRSDNYLDYVHEKNTYEEVISRKGDALRAAKILADQIKQDKQAENRLAIEKGKADRIAKKIIEEQEKEKAKIDREAKAELKKRGDKSVL